MVKIETLTTEKKYNVCRGEECWGRFRKDVSRGLKGSPPTHPARRCLDYAGHDTKPSKGWTKTSALHLLATTLDAGCHLGYLWRDG